MTEAVEALCPAARALRIKEGRLCSDGPKRVAPPILNATLLFPRKGRLNFLYTLYSTHFPENNRSGWIVLFR